MAARSPVCDTRDASVHVMYVSSAEHTPTYSPNWKNRDSSIVAILLCSSITRKNIMLIAKYFNLKWQ